MSMPVPSHRRLRHSWGPEFQACIGALYHVAFTLRMAQKFAGHNYGVAKLEGLWPGARTWSLLIRTPEFITKEHLDAAFAKLIQKGQDVCGRGGPSTATERRMVRAGAAQRPI